MKILDNLYKYLPVPLQNLGISLFGYRWQKRRFGGVYEREVVAFRSREYFSEAQWKDYQTQELRKLLVHAFNNVPFYREKYEKLGFNDEILGKFELEDLPKLPFLEKNELRQFGTTTMLANQLQEGAQFFASSGSTGTPVKINISNQMHQTWTAGYETRIRNWAGLNKEMARGMIGGRRVLPYAKAQKPFYRYNFFEKMVYFSAYHISSKSVANYVEAMKKHSVEYMIGYAMSNYFLARFIQEQGITPPKMKAVLTSSEKLTQEMRDVFKVVYGCESFDAWSGVEACALISECNHHTLHENPDIGIIELMNEQGEIVIGGGPGEAICTGFLNYNQPLIRYRCGDVLTRSEVPCACGRHMRAYKEINGRSEDIILGADGRLMVRFHGVFIGLQEVVEGQIIQHSIDRIEVKIVTLHPLSDISAQLIKSRIVSQLGQVSVEISVVNQIPRGNNGKFKAVISYVER